MVAGTDGNTTVRRALLGLSAVLVVLFVWEIAASYLFIALGRYTAPHFGADLDYPWLAYITYLTGHPTVWTKTLLGGAGILPALALVALGVLMWRRCGSRPGQRNTPLTQQRGVTDNHGHSAWATPEQLSARFSGPGCLIGAADRNVRSPLLFAPMTGPTHSLIFAGPDGHKSTAAITRLWHHDGPRLVFDPSCEIGPIMTPALEAESFNVISIGLGTGGINALDWIDPRHPEADSHIRTVCDHIYNDAAASQRNESHAKDPFWSNQGRKLVVCLAAHMIYSEGGELPKTLATLRRGIATPEADMKTMLAGIHATTNSSMARDQAAGLMGIKAHETFSGIYANANVATEWLSVPAYAEVVSGSAMRTSDLLDRKTVVFVNLPLITLLTTPHVIRVVMAAFFNAMFQADGKVDQRILFEIDEAWVLGAMKEIKLCYRTARKYRGTLCLKFQSEGDFEGIWGLDDAKLLRDCASWRSYNAIQDGDVAEKLSRDIGEHAVLAYSEGTNTGKQRQPLAWIGSSSRGDNVSIHEIRRRLIKADEIMRAPADEIYVLVRDFPHPIRACTAPYFRYPMLAARMAENRFVASAAE